MLLRMTVWKLAGDHKKERERERRDKRQEIQEHNQTFYTFTPFQFLSFFIIRVEVDRTPLWESRQGVTWVGVS